MTASETNNDYFTVERSKDANLFENLLIYPGAGTSNSPISYHAIDENPFAGNSFYRLMQTDFNGASTYSGIVPVNCESEEPFNLVSVNPGYQPHELVVNFTAARNETYYLGLYDITGQLIKQISGVAVEGFNEVRVDGTGLVEGLYLVTLKNHDKIFSRKVIIQ